MDILKHLKNLKTIMPDEGYSKRSRLLIVGDESGRERFTLKQFLIHNFQIGSAIALTSILLFLGFGGFSAWKLLSPFGLASLDPTNLRAEADAIRDMQVALQDVQYVISEAENTTTKIAPAEKIQNSAIKKLESAEKPFTLLDGLEILESPIETDGETASSTSIDAALDILLQ